MPTCSPGTQYMSLARCHPLYAWMECSCELGSGEADASCACAGSLCKARARVTPRHDVWELCWQLPLSLHVRR